MALTKVTSGVRDLGTGEVVATDLASTLDLSGKTVTLPAAAVTAHATAYDDSDLQNDIALLGFKVASNDSSVKFNLANQVVDDFQDTSGVSAGDSTNEFQDLAGAYIYGGSASSTTAWQFGAQASGSIPTGATLLGNATAGGGLASVFDSSNNQNQSTGASGGEHSYQSDPATSWVGIDLGALTTISGTQWNIYGSNDYGFNNTSSNGWTTHKLQASNSLTNTATSANSEWTDILTTGQISSVPGSDTSTFSATTQYRYWRYVFWQSQNSNGSLRIIDFSLYGVKNTTVEGGNMTLISNSSTAEVAPTKGDLVFSYSDGAGTATYTGGSPTIQAFISRNGAAYSGAVTLSKVGTAGGNTILAAHDVDLSGITAGTAMRYKITTIGQSASVRTRIHAVSLGWS